MNAAPETSSRPSRPSDLEGIVGRGRAARQAGESYFDNPFLLSTVPTDTPEQMAAWISLCEAWSAGWLAEDAGRDEGIARLMRLRYW